MIQDFAAAFKSSVNDTLSEFADTVGQCVAVCAAVSWHLDRQGITHQVALGSLYCQSMPTFKYSGFDIPENPQIDVFTVWDGHAWIEFPGGYIGEPSLLRTAQAAPKQSNLRMHLEGLGILSAGALLMTEAEALSGGLRYERICQLPRNLIEPLIGGLIATNEGKT